MHLNIIFILSFTLFDNLSAAPFDTGMITLQQPDRTEFTGRIWGDEFIYWMETEDGYRFVESFEGWYYYATLDQDGEYTPTNYKVGIDSPPASAYQLERSQARLNEIEEQIEQFNEQIELNREWFEQRQAEAQGQPVTLKVGIILIEFRDTTHYIAPYRPDGYTTVDFDSMMFSYNYWIGSGLESPHPEGEEVFGSFRNYWHQMSCGKLKIEGRVANPDNDHNGVPDWIMANYTKQHYYDSNDWQELSNEAITKALSVKYIDTTHTNYTNYFDKLVIVYAGVVRFHGALIVNGHRLGGKFIQLAERSSERLHHSPEWSFTHIGVYLHEFGHNLGFSEEYTSSPEEFITMTEDGGTQHFNFDLMAWGIYNGPLEKGECPSTLSPYYRIQSKWVNPDTLTNDEDNFIVEYDYENPKFYCIVPVNATENEHYIIETKKREGFDLYIPGNPSDSVNQAGRLLIWQHNTHRSTSSYVYHDRIRIIPGDNVRDGEMQNQLSDFFPATFSLNNIQNFNDVTLPGATINETTPYLNQPGEPAHFALNGIQKLANGNTLISEVRLFYPLKILNEISGSWQTISVPHILNDYNVQSVFPTRDPETFVYNSNYQPVTTVENGPGYWVKFYPGLQDLIFEGVDIISYLEIPVVTGWQITSSISYSVPLSNLQTNPPGIIDSRIYYCDGTYHEVTDFIKPGVGYWLKTSAQGFLILDKDGQPGAIEEIKYDEMDKFIVSDADGNKQTLYVSNIDIDTSLVNISTEMPPIFPELNFDSRFEYGELVKKVSADSGLIDINILVQTNAFPVNLSWEINPENGINYSFIGDSSSGKVSSILAESGHTSFNTLDGNRIQLFAKVDKNNYSSKIPIKYSLYQNYPNPFNPGTTIKYDIVEAQDVKIVVFDILGREATVLVNEQQQPGSYEVKWDATNVSSGIYFYQLITKDYVDTKKMILLK